jgi:hypothetical protein
MGISSYGSFFCLWAVRARSAQGRVFTEPWATSPTAGAMKIERGVVYNPTIHHGYLLEKNRHPGHRQPWPVRYFTMLLQHTRKEFMWLDLHILISIY